MPSWRFSGRPLPKPTPTPADVPPRAMRVLEAAFPAGQVLDNDDTPWTNRTDMSGTCTCLAIYSGCRGHKEA